MAMTVFQIRQRCKQIAEQFWGLNFDIPVEISKRMSSTMGQFTHIPSSKTSPSKAVKLTFSYDLLVNYKEDTIESVIAHEVCHWALFTLNQPNKDKHPYFESELKRVGGSTTRIIPHAGALHKVVCSGCGATMIRGTERQKNSYMKKVNYCVTKCCGVKFQYAGMEMVEDTYTLKKV